MFRQSPTTPFLKKEPLSSSPCRRCEARSMMALDDPLPLLRLALVRARRGISRAR